MSIVGWFSGRGPSGFGYNSTAEDVTEGIDLSGRTYVVTGANSGLGKETARVLAMRGARVFVGARSTAKAEATCAELSGNVVPWVCDLSDPASVRAAVSAVDGEVSAIVANAGIMALPERTLQHGYEAQFFTNHVGHFLLVTGLLGQLATDGRVVLVSSRAHTRAYPEGVRLDDLAADKHYSAWGAYGQSKLCNLLMARELAKRLPEGQRAYAIHPGVIATGIGRHLPGFAQWAFGTILPVIALKTIPQGAATQTYVAVNPGATQSGEYWSDCNVTASSKHGRDEALAAALWDKSEAIAASL